LAMVKRAQGLFSPKFLRYAKFGLEFGQNDKYGFKKIGLNLAGQ